VVTFGACCHPIPGDEIMGFLSAGKGVVVHRMDCPNVPEFRRNPDRWVAIDWDRPVQGHFRCALKIVVDNKPGVLATVAAAIAEAGSNIENIEYQERDIHAAALLFTLEVRDRTHLAEVMRRVRRSGVAHALSRPLG
jgi:guanosine-3',5'-bis(diphosphate) 3'-pyrophosphohydrolase